MPLTNEKLLIHIHVPPPPGWVEKVTSRFPGLKVQWERASVVNGSIENADSLPAEVWEGVTMALLFPPPSHNNMANVRYVQLASAGSEHWKDHPSYKDPNVLFCSASGCHA